MLPVACGILVHWQLGSKPSSPHGAASQQWTSQSPLEALALLKTSCQILLKASSQTKPRVLPHPFRQSAEFSLQVQPLREPLIALETM